MLSCASLGQTPTPSPSPTAATPSTEAAAAPAASSAPAPFAPGAKLFLEPMDGFERFLSDAIVKKKVPVVLVHERAKADFILSGEAHVKKRGFITGMVLSNRGGGKVSIKDARTGNLVFAYSFHRVDQGVTEIYVYQGWAEGCAKHLKKALEKRGK
jgi:hypothetical protein